MMLSMIVQALYNVVDSLFVSYIPDTPELLHAGDMAVNALTLAFPIQMLIMALCVGTGVGVNASLARSLGGGNREQAGRIAGNAMILSLGYYLVMLAFGLLGAHAYLESQTSDPVVLKFSFSYLSIITIYSFGTIGYMCFEKLLQATGKTTAAMTGQLVGSLTNIILDPVFIFGYFGVPAMGVTGAAVATIIGQCASFVVITLLHFCCNREVPFRLALLRPNRKIIFEIYRVGGPAIVMQSLTSVMTYGHEPHPGFCVCHRGSWLTASTISCRISFSCLPMASTMPLFLFYPSIMVPKKLAASVRLSAGGWARYRSL